MTTERPLFAGKYELIVELGRGGMATVYLAALRGPGGFSKLQVVKRLHRELAEQPEFLTMFLEEARLAARIEHPNVVQTNEVGADGREPYIAMEYLEGQSFDAVLRRARRNAGMPLSLQLRVVCDALAGLHFAHELRDFDGTPLHVVHRDVSPHNVLITYEGAVKVVDFGIAKAADSTAQTKTGVLKGKVAYMAPEQIAGEPLDRRADVFSAGVMLWQAITGERIWPSGMPEVEIIRRLGAGEIPTPRSVRGDVDPALEAICMRAIAPKREDRWATAAEMRDAIEERLAATTASNRAVGRWVSELFADSRAEIRAAIESRMSAGAVTLTDVPDLRSLLHAPPSGPTSVSGLLAQRADAPIDDGATRIDRPSRPVTAAQRPWRATLAIAAGVVVLGIVALVALGKRGSAPTHASSEKPAPSARPPVSLTSPTCPIVVGNAKDPNAIVVGALFALAGDEETGTFPRNILELAISEINQASLGIPGGPGGARRPIAAVVCDNVRDVDASARHLVEELHVPAIIGPSRSAQAIDVATRFTVPNDVLLLCPECASPAMRTLDDRGLVWEVQTPTDLEGAALVAAVADYEKTAREALALGKNEHLRLAVLDSKEFVYAASANLFATGVRFNGEDAIANGDDFLRVDYDAPEGSKPPDPSRVVERLVAFAPHLVVAIGGAEISTTLIPSLEKRWPAGAKRPLYLLTAGSTLAATVDLARNDEGLRKRIVGITDTTPAESAPVERAYLLRYRAAYGDVTGDTGAAYYDAAYALVYAMAAAGEGELTGSKIAAGMKKLVPPAQERIAVGPDDNAINRALGILAKGGRVDLVGSSAELDFDEAGGLPRGGTVFWCVSKGSPAQRELRIFNTARVYDPKTKTFSGSLACP